MSLAGSVVDINFEFQSNDDGHNGQNDGVRGVAFDNISLEEFTFNPVKFRLLMTMLY
jgi:hypothetical protein